MKKIVLIEDDTILRETTTELLQLSNYEVQTASDGKKGVLLAQNYLPDVIVCDIMMPELDGYGVLQALSTNARTKSIPFIFLSAKTERKDIRKGMNLGADDYLTKPFEEQELIGAIESRLAKMAILKDSKDTTGSATPNEDQAMYSLHQLKNFIDDQGEELHYGAGDYIYREGMHSNKVYLIINGIVKTHKLDEMGKELITGIYKADDFFGFTSFTKNTPHQEYATAMEETKMMSISAGQLKDLLEKNHALTMELMQALSEYLSEAKEQLLEMAYGSVRRKAAHTILKFAEKLQKDSNGNLHVLRSDLASVAGMATETLIRTLSSFKKEGLIRIDNRNIKILDADALKRMT